MQSKSGLAEIRRGIAYVFGAATLEGESWFLAAIEVTRDARVVSFLIRTAQLSLAAVILMNALLDAGVIEGNRGNDVRQRDEYRRVRPDIFSFFRAYWDRTPGGRLPVSRTP